MKLPPSFTPGHRAEIGSHLFSEADIIAFASKYDPQVFHIDPQAAKASLFGGHCASGWHTAAMWMRKQRDHETRSAADWQASGGSPVEYGPSPGFRALKWLRPVHAGDTITYYTTTKECRPSGSRPGWLVTTTLNEGFNQRGEPVISFETSVLVRAAD